MKDVTNSYILNKCLFSALDFIAPSNWHLSLFSMPIQPWQQHQHQQRQHCNSNNSKHCYTHKIQSHTRTDIFHWIVSHQLQYIRVDTHTYTKINLSEEKTNKQIIYQNCQENASTHTRSQLRNFTERSTLSNVRTIIISFSFRKMCAVQRVNSFGNRS